jgi:putative ATPase
MKHVGYGKDYRYVHSDPAAKDEMECLPEQLRGRKYFHDDDPIKGLKSEREN